MTQKEYNKLIAEAYQLRDQLLTLAKNMETKMTYYVDGFTSKTCSKTALVRSLIRDYWDDYMETLFWQASDVVEDKDICLDDYLLDYDGESEPVSFSVLKWAYTELEDFFTCALEYDTDLYAVLDSPSSYGISSHIGHDICLTQNRRGAGFWDGDYDVEFKEENLGKIFTDFAHSLGDIDLYIGDDGRIYA